MTAVTEYITYSERGYFSVSSEEILYFRIGQELKEL